MNIMKGRIEESKSVITSSFSDIIQLKQNAKLMIEIASVLKAKVTNGSKTLENIDGSENIVEDINKILNNIGFIDPITKETSGSNYYINLSQQISDFLLNYFKNTNTSLISLIDAYCMYNRARGISKLIHINLFYVILLNIYFISIYVIFI